MKYWEIIAERLKSRGWSYGYCTIVNRRGERVYVVSAHRDDGKRYVFHSDEILTAFLELEQQARFKHQPRHLMNRPQLPAGLGKIGKTPFTGTDSWGG